MGLFFLIALYAVLLVLPLAPDGHAGLDYKAGQFAWLNVGKPAFSLHENPFSIASAPAAGPEISFIIRNSVISPAPLARSCRARVPMLMRPMAR